MEIPKIFTIANTAKPEIKPTKATLPKITNKAVELSNDNGGIIINNAATWQLEIPSFLATLEPNIYLYDLQTIDSEGNIVTYLKGQWIITEDITRP